MKISLFLTLLVLYMMSFSLQGRFEIISLSGSVLISENNNGRSSRTGSLSVSLAGSDGRVLGGGVTGSLTAASPVQVLLSNGRKFISCKQWTYNEIYLQPL